MPVAIKDLLYTRGIRTTGGSKILADFVPDHDSTVWKRLAEAGAVLLGKLNLHEFAYGLSCTNPHWGTVRNPYGLDRIPGGSSGGAAAAIVARMAAATIGTDTGGSIRIPAALCGCVGLKPTFSRVSRHGVIPLANTLDHVGPIARTVRDAALMLGVIAGHDPDDSTSSRNPVPDYTAALGIDNGIAGLRIGVIRELNYGLSNDVARSFNAALKQLAAMGAAVEEVSAPAIETASVATTVVMLAEALEYHEHWMRTRPGDYGADVRVAPGDGNGRSGYQLRADATGARGDSGRRDARAGGPRRPGRSGQRDSGATNRRGDGASRWGRQHGHGPGDHPVHVALQCDRPAGARDSDRAFGGWAAALDADNRAAVR